MKNLFQLFSKKHKREKRLRGVIENSYASFLKTGKTSHEGHMALIDLYCATNGKFNDEINSKIVRENPKSLYDSSINSAILGECDDEKYEKINTDLNQNGYAFFSNKLPESIVDSLNKYAKEAPAYMAPKYDMSTVFDESNIQSEIYRFNAQDLVNNTDIQKLIMDPFFINMARKYLGCEPIFDFPAMWWSTAFLKEASSEAAQLYHFDLDRIKWLKIFIYLTDVTDETGPHCYINGSHIPGSKPKILLKRGYARIPDEDLAQFHDKTDFVKINAEAGTVFAGDTKCWHKGTPLKKGNRLVLEFEYTTSLFGTNYDKFKMENFTPEFKEFCLKNPFYATNFEF